MSGFLAFSRGTMMLDIIAIGLFAFVPLLAYSLYKVRAHKAYETHRRYQTFLSTLLLILVSLFELELRLYGWRQHAEASPYYNTIIPPFLNVHLTFAISTSILWMVTFVTAYRRFERPAVPNTFSRKHIVLGRVTVIGTLLTGVTGWIFYYLAFIAT